MDKSSGAFGFLVCSCGGREHYFRIPVKTSSIFLMQMTRESESFFAERPCVAIATASPLAVKRSCMWPHITVRRPKYTKNVLM